MAMLRLFLFEVYMTQVGEILLTVKQTAEEIGVSTVQVTRYHREGLLPFVSNGKRGRGESRLTPLSAARDFVRPKPGPKPQAGGDAQAERS